MQNYTLHIYYNRNVNGFQRNNSDGSLTRQLYKRTLVITNRSEMRENQRKLVSENEELRQKIELMEEELDIMRIEREAEYDKQKQEEEQKKFFESEFHMDMLLEQDRKFATHLVTEIWRGMCLDDLT